MKATNTDPNEVLYLMMIQLIRILIRGLLFLCKTAHHGHSGVIVGGTRVSRNQQGGVNIFADPLMTSFAFYMLQIGILGSIIKGIIIKD